MRVDRLNQKQRTELMSKVRGRDTKPELAVRRLVHRLGFRYRLYGRGLPGKPDLVFRSKRKIIFIHGCFWHQHRCKRGTRPVTNTGFWTAKLDRNLSRDRANMRALKLLGWSILVIWECEVKHEGRLAKRLTRFLSAL